MSKRIYEIGGSLVQRCVLADELNELQGMLSKRYGI